MKMASLLKVCLTCLVADRVYTHIQTSYQPYGPRMCEALYQNEATSWDFDEVHLVCKPRFSSPVEHRIQNRNRHLVQSTHSVPEEKTDTSAHGFIMHTSKALYLVDRELRKHKVSMRYHRSMDYSYCYDSGLIYMFNTNNGIIYKGVLWNMRLNFKRYGQIIVKNIDRTAVDQKNNIFVLISMSSSYTIQWYDISTQKARKLAEELCSDSAIVIDKHSRTIYFIQRHKLCSMDYQGNGNRIFDKIKLQKASFYLEFQEGHLLCTALINGRLVRYLFDRKSEETAIKRTRRSCPVGNRDMIKMGELIIAVHEQYQGIVVVEGEKCHWMWKHMNVIALLTLE